MNFTAEVSGAGKIACFKKSESSSPPRPGCKLRILPEGIVPKEDLNAIFQTSGCVDLRLGDAAKLDNFFDDYVFGPNYRLSTTAKLQLTEILLSADLKGSLPTHHPRRVLPPPEGHSMESEAPAKKKKNKTKTKEGPEPEPELAPPKKTPKPELAPPKKTTEPELAPPKKKKMKEEPEPELAPPEPELSDFYDLLAESESYSAEDFRDLIPFGSPDDKDAGAAAAWSSWPASPLPALVCSPDQRWPASPLPALVCSPDPRSPDCPWPSISDSSQSQSPPAVKKTTTTTTTAARRPDCWRPWISQSSPASPVPAPARSPVPPVNIPLDARPVPAPEEPDCWWPSISASSQSQLPPAAERLLLLWRRPPTHPAPCPTYLTNC